MSEPKKQEIIDAPPEWLMAAIAKHQEETGSAPTKEQIKKWNFAPGVPGLTESSSKDKDTQ
jgi:hypothetical protein